MNTFKNRNNKLKILNISSERTEEMDRRKKNNRKEIYLYIMVSLARVF